MPPEPTEARIDRLEVARNTLKVPSLPCLTSDPVTLGISVS